MAISVVVADDHQLVIGALRASFEKVKDVEIVGETTRGDDVLALVESLGPDVLVLDLTMPGVDGLEVMRRLAERQSAVRVVILSMHTTASYAARAVKLGAVGYVGKNAPSTELVRAIRAAAAGKRYLAEPLTIEQIEAYEQRLESGKLDLFDTLSNRERQVMKLTALGKTSREISEALNIGRRTVETYLANVTEKLGIKSRSELVRHAVRVGILPEEDD
jgi:two-component system response regulator NreC